MDLVDPSLNYVTVSSFDELDGHNMPIILYLLFFGAQTEYSYARTYCVYTFLFSDYLLLIAIFFLNSAFAFSSMAHEIY